MPIKKFVTFIIFSFFLLFYLKSNVFAQFGSTFAEYLPISEEKIETGDLISLKDGQYKKSAQRYDPSVAGVIDLNPAMVVESSITKAAGFAPIISSGETRVKFNSKLGNVKRGDYITTSEIPGVAVKFEPTKGVSPLGIALKDTELTDSDEVVLLEAFLYKRNYFVEQDNPYRENVLTAFVDRLKVGDMQRYESPSQLIRVFFGIVTILGSFVLGFLAFKRFIAKGLVSLGRNPLAAKYILFNMFLGLILVIVILGFGLFLGYFIVTI